MVYEASAQRTGGGGGRPDGPHVPEATVVKEQLRADDTSSE